MVPKSLLHVSVRELHNNLVSDTDDGGLKEAIDAENNIIISDSTLCSLFPPQYGNIPWALKKKRKGNSKINY